MKTIKMEMVQKELEQTTRTLLKVTEEAEEDLKEAIEVEDAEEEAEVEQEVISMVLSEVAEVVEEAEEDIHKSNHNHPISNRIQEIIKIKWALQIKKGQDNLLLIVLI